MYRRCLALLLVLCACCSRAETLTYRPLGSAEGLDIKVVSSLLVDRNGLLWIASREGLYRYDGYRATPVGNSSGGLPDSDLRALFEDSAGRIWVASNTSGLSRYDPHTGSFAHFRHNTADPHSLSHDSIYGMAEDAAGQLWAGSQIGLNRLDPASGRVERFFHDPGDPRSLSHDYVYEVLADETGSQLWVATIGGGINRRRVGDSGFERFDLARMLDGPDSLNSVFALARWGESKMFAGTRHGLVEMDIDSGRARLVDIGTGDATVVPALAWGPSGRLWIGTMAHGVQVYDLRTGAVSPANAAPLGEDGQLPALPQLQLLFSGERLFVGTWGSGVYTARLNQSAYGLISAGESPGQLRHHNVTAVLAGSGGDGSNWVGTFGGGLQALSGNGGGVDLPPGPEDALWSDGVLAIARRRNGQLLAGTNNGLWIFREGGGRRFIDSESGRGLGAGYVTSLLETEAGDLWVGVGGSGLFRLAAGQSRFVPYVHDPGKPRSLSGNYITALLQLDGGRLLAGTRSSDLNLCRTSPWRCVRLGSAEGLAHHNVTTLHRSAAGDIWVGTDGGGLHQFRLAGANTLRLRRRWTQRDGLLSDSVMGIVEDDDGSLWLSSRQGLSRLQPQTGELVHHVAATGLPVTHFNARAAARDRQRLYFGGIGGLVSMPAGTAMQKRAPSPVRLVELSRLGPDGDMVTQPAAALERVTLNWGEMLSVSFAVLDYARGQHLYQYRLDDSGPWQSLGPRRELTLLELSPGHHRLQVRGRDAFGSWGQSPPLELKVVPPLWMRGWFRAGALALLLLLAWALHHRRLRSLRRRNRLLEQLRRQREDALEEAQASGRQLADAHAGLRNLAARLQSAREEQRQQIARELHDELGQTLTAAKISLQRVGSAGDDGERAGRLRESVAMLDGMIAQVRNISLSLRPPLLDDAGLVNALEVYLDSVAGRSGVAIRFSADRAIRGESQRARTAIFRLVQEAVSNVLRHAGATEIEVHLTREGRRLRLRVEDNGRGFNPASTWERVRRGEHLGLLGMLERARNAGGELDFAARPGIGSRVSAEIPL